MVFENELPSWLEPRSAKLREAFKDKDFSTEEARKVLAESGGKLKAAGVVLAKLVKAGVLVTEPDKQDARKTRYKFVSRTDAPQPEAGTLNRSDLDALLKRAADLIRTRVDYKFILVLLFLKRVSDKWQLEYEKAYKEAIKDGLSEQDARKEAASAAYHDFDMPEEYLWDNLRKDVTRLPEKFSKALKSLAERNPPLRDVLDHADFIQFTASSENAEVLRQLVELFSEKRLSHVSADVLGDAYEWILRYFAPDKAKEGEIYTPREVIRLLIEILDPKPKKSVYDPACGSGGMLIEAYRHVKEKHGLVPAQQLFLRGQEANQRTIAFAKMNMYIHDIINAKLEYGDTFLYPKFKQGDYIEQFDFVIANPPWNQDGYDEEVLKKGEFWQKRFRYGFTPSSSADWAWIQHMLASCKEDTGRVAVVMDSGALFRGGKEQAIRKKIIDAGFLECVILLPEKLFYNTGAPGTILVFNRKKATSQDKTVLFIDASKEYRKHSDVRKLNQLSQENIEKIAKTYRNNRPEPGFSAVVKIERIQAEDYNLNVTRYVDSIEQEEKIDVKKTFDDLKATEKRQAEIEKQLEEYLKVLGYD